ncbi:MAG: flagellar hook-basal body protein [Tepidisphaeraceae bacterium]
MIYGLYLSATGVLTNSYRQDIIANNLANAETVGFKRDVALFHERLTEAQMRLGRAGWSNPDLERLGGGLLASPTLVDSTQGELEPTGHGMDVAIQGPGFFQVRTHDKLQRLTRDGRFGLDRDGYLILANGTGERVMDPAGKPIQLDPTIAPEIDREGTVTQNGQPVARLGLYEAPDPRLLKKEGGNLLSYAEPNRLRTAGPATTLRSAFIERANVDPATELAVLMDAQRQLEANANMIRYQDSMLAKLVNEVGKI